MDLIGVSSKTLHTLTGFGVEVPSFLTVLLLYVQEVRASFVDGQHSTLHDASCLYDA